MMGRLRGRKVDKEVVTVKKDVPREEKGWAFGSSRTSPTLHLLMCNRASTAISGEVRLNQCKCICARQSSTQVEQ